MRLAIFGGTFDPIHYGHLRAAEVARSKLGLDKVVFVPAALQPNKPIGSASPALDRLRMTRLAVKGNPAFECSDIEIKRGGVSFTRDTLEGFKAKLSPKDSLYLMVGSDSFNEISSWNGFEEIISLASIIVMPRPGYPMLALKKALPVELASLFCYDKGSGTYRNPKGNEIIPIDEPLLTVSATFIRDTLKAGGSVSYLVLPKVEEYMITHKLYR